jgi:large subunit ribosomal protein L25
MSEIKLSAEPRTAFGKGAARRIRRDHKIPAVLYGHGTEPVHITLPGHETQRALKSANALLSIELEGTSQLALAKDVQRDPIRPVIEHIDLVIVKLGEKVTVDVPVHTEGEAGPETIVTLERQTVELLVLATNIPQAIVVSIEDLPAGTQIHAGQITLPEGAELVTDPGALVVNIAGMISQEALDAELSGEEGQAEAAAQGPAAPDEAAPE